MSEQTVWQPTTEIAPDVSESAKRMEAVLYEVKKIVVGQDAFLERIMVAMLSGGHLLIEGVPGLAKTLTVSTLAKVLQGSFKRIQFTPDLLPADLVGTRIYNQKLSEFSIELGPVFANLLLADEINRAPAKVQSALLEVMQERQVTIAGHTHPLPAPFVVMATQNPIESEGTYPLPEAQVDRFMMKVLVGYPTREEEFVIVQRAIGEHIAVHARADTQQLHEIQQQCNKGFVDSALVQFAVELVNATRFPEKSGLTELAPLVTFGASPRASISLVQAARALAFLRGRAYTTPQDMLDLVHDVLRHRIVLSYEALAQGINTDDVIAQTLKAIRIPERPLHRHAQVPEAFTA
jgi:MoxR-like ATPase